FPCRADIHYFAQTGDSGTNHLNASQLRRRQHVGARELLHDSLGQTGYPLREWKVFQKSAKYGEFEMGVGVDETGDNRAAGELDQTALSRGRLNPAVLDCESAVADGRTGRRTQPVRLVDRHAAKTCERMVSFWMRSSLTPY